MSLTSHSVYSPPKTAVTPLPQGTLWAEHRPTSLLQATPSALQRAPTPCPHTTQRVLFPSISLHLPPPLSVVLHSSQRNSRSTSPHQANTAICPPPPPTVSTPPNLHSFLLLLKKPLASKWLFPALFLVSYYSSPTNEPVVADCEY